MKEITIERLLAQGLDQATAHSIFSSIKSTSYSKNVNWTCIANILSENKIPFEFHVKIFTALFPSWHEHPETAPAWMPSREIIENANIQKFMNELDIHDIYHFHQWTINNYEDFWEKITNKLEIKFKKNSDRICDLSQGIESPQWFPNAELNIIDSCFNAPPSATALIYQDDNKNIIKLSYDELNKLSNQIANSLIKLGFKDNDAIAIVMPMNHYAIASYLAIIKMGGAVVSIADSFSSQEIASRLTIANSKAIITQDVINWNNKQIPLYNKICNVTSIPIIVISNNTDIKTRIHDITWKNFLIDNTNFTSTAKHPMSACNILFSSGTTAEPKAIIWNHTTPIKAASDAYFHQNIQANDVLCWPTNLGWMMGPWLIFAALINKASIALYTDLPKGKSFGEFVQNTKVTMLGVVPTLVADWRQSQCMQTCDWSTIKVFSSSGECSNAEDMLYLMSLANYKPVIEYCGGTEIGGAYLSSTVIQANYPSLFSIPTMGLSFDIIDESGHSTDIGEVAIIPPSIGLSTQLLNADHHNIYFANMPKNSSHNILRRHSDQIKRFANHTYCILGRVDDTMNLGGIKVSAAEIERSINGIENIIEVAAIAVNSPNNGPSQLVIYAATNAALNKNNIHQIMQKKINAHLNPLFKIHDVIFVNELPKTASNKIMRRILRKKYMEGLH